jgi:hypothetical protein
MFGQFDSGIAKKGHPMATHLKILLASAGLLASSPAFAHAYFLSPVATGGGNYTFKIDDNAPGKNTYTDTFSFTIPGTSNGASDLGVFNVAASNSTGNIDFLSGTLTGPSTNVALIASNIGANSSLGNLASIPVVFGATYLLSVTYKAGGSNASFSGNVAFSPAPEPAAWAMMLLGFAVVGAGLRHAQRSKQKVALSYS